MRNLYMTLILLISTQLHANDYNMSNFYGNWKVVKIDRIAGSRLLPTNAVSQVTQTIRLEKDKINLLGYVSKNVTYKEKTIQINKEHRGDRTMTIYYGHLPERKRLHQESAYKDDFIFINFEIIDSRHIVFLLLGHVYTLKR